MTSCPECGFALLAIDADAVASGNPFGWVYDETMSASAADMIRTTCAGIGSSVRAGENDDLRRRPAPERWSPLEYACHVRDVLLVQRERVIGALCGDTTVGRPMRRDERVVIEGYAEQDPDDVATEVVHAALLFTNVLDRLDDAAWGREIVYNFPRPTPRTLRWVAVHTAHECVHHLADMRAGSTTP